MFFYVVAQESVVSSKKIQLLAPSWCGKMTKFTAYAALQAKEKLQLWEYEPAPLKDSDIEIRVTHNGLCHTDIHMRDNDWCEDYFGCSHLQR